VPRAKRLILGALAIGWAIVLFGVAAVALDSSPALNDGLSITDQATTTLLAAIRPPGLAEALSFGESAQTTVIAAIRPKLSDSVLLSDIASTQLILGPRISVNPVSVTFPDQFVGQTVGAGVTITNSGQTDLNVGSVGIVGLNPSDFTIRTNGCSGISVAPAGTCAISLGFTPTAGGSRNATLTLASNAPQSTSIGLSGNGLTDLTPPTSSATLTPAPNAAGWNKADVTVSLAAVDNAGGSGVATIAYSLTGSQTLASATVAGNAASVTINTEGVTTLSYFATDNAGNVEAANSLTVRLDKSAPSVACASPDGAWSNTDVTVPCTSSDGGSGLLTPSDGTFTLATSVAANTETAVASTNSRTVCDVAGNCSTAGPLTGIHIDKKAPVVTCGAPDGLWHAADVVIGCTAGDGGSGLASATDASFALSTSVPIGTETTTASTGTHQVCDVVGNCTVGGPFTGIMVDKAAPTLVCGAPDTVWHVANVTIGCTALDGGSGLANPGDNNFGLSTSVPAGTETSNASTSSHRVCDAVGNCSTAGPLSGIKVDRKAPSVSCGAADGLWHSGDVVIACTAGDGGSGLANPVDASFTLSTSVAPGTETANAATNSHTVCDTLGNCSIAGPIGGNKVDKKAPTTTATASRIPPAPGAPTVVVNLTQVTVTPGGSLGPITCWNSAGVVVSLAAVDGGSGPANITYSITGAQATATTTVTGAHATTTVSKPGTSTITYYATDAVGNVETAKKLLVLNGGWISCATVPALVTVPTQGTVTIVGSIVITYGNYTVTYPFNVTFPYKLS
jgi:Abnormal spindle-like microcephaly-assoc'd, ASPM-SPD-2-Hydin